MPLSRENEQLDKIVVGVDEAGRGPFAGPLVVAACYLPPQAHFVNAIKDSKKIKNKQTLKRTYDEICEKAYFVCMTVPSKKVDKDDNILKTTLATMSNCIEQFPLTADMAYIDGNKVPENAPCPCTSIVKGDDKYMNIAAASIVAKYTRDKWMVERAHKRYPKYGFNTNMGYGSLEHRQAIVKYGVTPIHRISYEPMASIVKNPTVPREQFIKI